MYADPSDDPREDDHPSDINMAQEDALGHIEKAVISEQELVTRNRLDAELVMLRLEEQGRQDLEDFDFFYGFADSLITLERFDFPSFRLPVSPPDSRQSSAIPSPSLLAEQSLPLSIPASFVNPHARPDPPVDLPQESNPSPIREPTETPPSPGSDHVPAHQSRPLNDSLSGDEREDMDDEGMDVDVGVVEREGIGRKQKRVSSQGKGTLF